VEVSFVFAHIHQRAQASISDNKRNRRYASSV